MSWIKRNISFVVLSVIAVVALGAAGWYCFSKWQLDKTSWDELNAAYDELRTLGAAKPNPGNKSVDNVKRAREQQTELNKEIQKIARFFTPIPAIPDAPNVSDQDFATGLRQTVNQLQRDAATASVILPPDYPFSFFVQRTEVKFPAGSTLPLAQQLGEVKAICDVLFAARVNSLDKIRRERVSEIDTRGPLGDYLDEKSVTNENAVLTPYEVTFRCFSSELAGVLAGMANQSHAMIVRAINVEQPGAATSSANMMTTPANTTGMVMNDQGFMVPASSLGSPAGPAPGLPTPGVAPTVRRGGLPIILDEKQVRVTMVINVVKLLPKK
jgi:hypothetical protein